MNVTNTASIMIVSAIAVIVFVFLTLFFVDVTGMFVGTIINSFCGIYFIPYHSVSRPNGSSSYCVVS